MCEITSILKRHKLPNIRAYLIKYSEEIVPYRDILNGTNMKIDRSQDGMIWCGVSHNDYITGLGYAPDTEIAHCLAIYDFLETNEIHNTDIFKDVEF